MHEPIRVRDHGEVRSATVAAAFHGVIPSTPRSRGTVAALASVARDFCVRRETSHTGIRVATRHLDGQFGACGTSSGLSCWAPTSAFNSDPFRGARVQRRPSNRVDSRATPMRVPARNPRVPSLSPTSRDDGNRPHTRPHRWRVGSRARLAPRRRRDRRHTPVVRITQPRGGCGYLTAGFRSARSCTSSGRPCAHYWCGRVPPLSGGQRADGRETGGLRPFHNSDLGSTRRPSSHGSISSACLLRCASANGELTIHRTTVGSRSASRRSSVTPPRHHQCRNSSALDNAETTS